MTQHETTRRKNHKATQTKNHTKTTALERPAAYATGRFKAPLLSTDLHPGSRCNSWFKIHNGSLTQSMHHNDNTKIKLITMMKQRRVLLANPTNTANQQERKPLVEPRHGGSSKRHTCSIKPQPTCESFMKRPPLSLRPEPPPCN